MTGVLVRKTLRDLRLALVIVCLLLAGFECLWVKITARITGELVPFFMALAAAQKIAPAGVEEMLFRGPGRIMRTLMGGEMIRLDHAMDMLSIGYVHPLVQAVLCIWAVGRASGAIAGEIDRGTMDLLLAQPIARWRLVVAHLCVDLVTIPMLCLALWGGTWVGAWLVGPVIEQQSQPPPLEVTGRVDPERLQFRPMDFGPALLNVGALVFAVAGYTMWLSARGRFRARVLGVAVLVTMLQFLVNVVGQMWDAAAWLRPFTVFYYYQPQQIALAGRWTVAIGSAWHAGPMLVPVVPALLAIGAAGYALALWSFCRRDLPAPL